MLFDAERAAKAMQDPEFGVFQERAQKLEHKLMEVIAAEEHGDLRVVVAALGPLIAKAVAHLVPLTGKTDLTAVMEFVITTFKQLAALTIDHYQTCDHLEKKPEKTETLKDDPYAPPSVTH